MNDVHTDAQSQGTAGWARSVDLAVRCVFAIPVALVFLSTWRPMSAEFDRLAGAGQLGLILLGATQLAVIALAMSGRSRFVFDLMLVLVTATALVLVLVGQPAGPWQSSWWPTSAVHTVQLWVLGFGGRYRWWLGSAALVVFAGLRLTATTLSGDPLQLGFAEVLWGAQLSLTLVLAVLAVRRIAARHDRAESERARVLEAEAAQQAQEVRGHAVNRFLHDEVMHSLRAIALPRGRVPAEQACELAARTAARLQGGYPSGVVGTRVEVGVRLAEIAAELGLQVSVQGRLAGLPDDVAEALECAGAEALRNVQRHAGTDRVRIRCETRGYQVVVLIADDGHGFDTARLGSGLRHSVEARMAEIGGCASIDAGPGGTTVELVWAAEQVDQRIARNWADLTRALTPIALPGIGATVLMGLLLLDEIANPPLLLLGLLVVTVAGLAAIRWSAARLSHGALPVLLGAVVIGLVTNVLAVSPATSNGYHLLMAGGVAPVLMLVAIHYPLRWSVPALILVWMTLAGLLASRFGVDAMTGPLVGALTGPCAVLGVVLLKAVLRWVARRTLTAQDATIRSRLRIAHSGLRSIDDDERLQRTRGRILPFLQAVAHGQVDLADPATAARALRLEAAVREELRWGRTPDAVARAADAARGRGWQVELRLTEAQLRQHRDVLVVLVGALGAGQGPGRAVVSAFGGPGLVVQSPTAHQLDVWRKRTDLRVEEADGWCRLLVEVPAKGDSPQRAEETRLPV